MVVNLEKKTLAESNFFYASSSMYSGFRSDKERKGAKACDDAPLSPSIVKMLTERFYRKRKTAAVKIEKFDKEFF